MIDKNASREPTYRGAEQSGSGSVATDGGVAAGERGVAVGGNFSGTISIGATAKKTTIPRQGPPPPKHYVPRNEGTMIQETLLREDSKPVVVLYGISGVGKTALVANLIKTEEMVARFSDGVLWGDLNNYGPMEQLATFLRAVDDQSILTGQNEGSRADQFWQIVSEKKMLIVLDNVIGQAQIAKLLPSDGHWPRHCRILMIGITKFDDQAWIEQQVPLSVFTEEEALILFANYIGETQISPYLDSLREIARLVEYRPNLVTNSAIRLAEGQISPYALVQQLQRSQTSTHGLHKRDWEAYELIMQTLSLEQVHLLEATAVLGSGDFNQAMAAAITLMSLEEVKSALDSLVQYGLLQYTEQGRYARNTAFAAFLMQRFEQWESYKREAAAHLLARYCHDLVQDLADKFGLTVGSEIAIDGIDHKQLEPFQTGLRLELSHIRQVMEWAQQTEQWNLIARFAYAPYMGLLQRLTVNGGYTSLDLVMADVSDFIGWHRGESIRFRLSQCWGQQIRFEGTPGEVLFVGENFQHATIERKMQPSRPEFTVNAYASQISGFILHEAALVDSTWLGVKATGVVLRHTDMVGCKFIASDLKESVWVHCDARNARLVGSDLSYAILRYVNFRGADLQKVNLTGAVLDNVDFRGANLHGADLTGVIMFNVNLISCDLTNVEWTSARGNIFLGENRKFVAAAINELASKLSIKSLKNSIWMGYDLEQAKSTKIIGNFENAQLQGVEMGSTEISGNFENAQLQGADFSSATIDGNFKNAQFQGADFSSATIDGNFDNAQFQGADLGSASISGNFENAQFQGADFSSATISGNFKNPQFQGADFGSASISGNFENAQFQGADFSSATFDGNFDNAVLNSANLSRARIKGCNLNGVDLCETALDDTKFEYTALNGCNLQNAELLGADLKKCSLVFSDLSNARISSSVNWQDLDLSFADLRGTGIKLSELSEAKGFGTLVDGNTTPNGVSGSIPEALTRIAIGLRKHLTEPIYHHIDGVLQRIESRILQREEEWSVLRTEIWETVVDLLQLEEGKAKEIVDTLRHEFAAIGLVDVRIEPYGIQHYEITPVSVQRYYEKIVELDESEVTDDTG